MHASKVLTVVDEDSLWSHVSGCLGTTHAKISVPLSCPFEEYFLCVAETEHVTLP
jgi:hypothetical protein